MNVLAIETSGLIGSVAACRDDDVLAEDSLDRGMEHGRMLVALLDRVVRLAGWDKARDIELVAVSRGPGSFTGLRVGITCAKTLAMTLAKPLLGVCSLDALAENAPPEYSRVLTVLDAKRGDVYAAAYERVQGRLRRTAGPAVMRPGEALDLLPDSVFVMGDALTRHREAFATPRCRCASEELWRIRAQMVARLGLAAFHQGCREEPIGLEPIYLRRPEAEERRLARERGGS